MQNSAGAAKMRERHPVGSMANVAYAPHDASIAFLEPGPSSFALMPGDIGAFIALVGFRVRRKDSTGIGTMNQTGATDNSETGD